MLNFGGYEEHAAGGNLTILVSGAKASPAANDVVHFVLTMRALRIGSTGGEHVKACAHARYAKKLLVEFAALRAFQLDSGNVGKQGLHPRIVHARIRHARMPAKTRSVNCG